LLLEGAALKRMRACLHCALARALGDEADELVRRRVVVTFGRSEAVWLPIPGARIYRGLRHLLRRAAVAGEGHTVRLNIIDLAGKAHVEVTAAVLAGAHAQVFTCMFPRFVAASLLLGFDEGQR
jgi:hypothetical protein